MARSALESKPTGPWSFALLGRDETIGEVQRGWQYLHAFCNTNVLWIKRHERAVGLFAGRSLWQPLTEQVECLQGLNQRLYVPFELGVERI